MADAVDSRVLKGRNSEAKITLVFTILYYASLFYTTIVEGTRFLLYKATDLYTKTVTGKTPLLLVCEECNKDLVKNLIERGCDVNYPGPGNRTALHHAARRGWFDIVELLVKNGAYPDVQTSSGDTALLIAAKYKFEDIVRLLTSYTSTLDCCADDIKNWTALHYASHYGWLEAVKSLCNRGANLDVKDSEGLTPLLVAIRNYQKGTLRLLVQLGANLDCCDAQKNTALHYVSKYGWLDEVKLLMGRGAEIEVKNSEGLTPLHVAAQTSLVETQDIIEVLIDAGADFDDHDENNSTILHRAAEEGWPGVVKAVVKRKAEIDIELKGATPLLLAAEKGHKHVVLLLIDAGADITCCDNEKMTVLWYALKNGWQDVMILLAHRGVDLDTESPSGDTPLLSAAKNAHQEIARLLIQLGVNLHYRDSEGWTALHYAALHKLPSVVRYIVQKGGDVNAEAQNGMTPLHCACQFNRRALMEVDDVDQVISDCMEVVQILCSRGADINARACGGQTPAHLAFRGLFMTVEVSLKVKMFSCLFKAGADCNMADDASKFLFHLFISTNNVHLVKLGIEHGGYFSDISLDRNLHLVRILQDVSLCTRAILNKFNNKDLPSVYEFCDLSDTFPSIERMKISPQSGIAKDIEKAVRKDIETRGYCNVPLVIPMTLTMLTVKSVLLYFNNNFN